jgi:hypothetical protein
MQQLNWLFYLASRAGRLDQTRELGSVGMHVLRGARGDACKLGCSKTAIADAIVLGLECGRQDVKCDFLDLTHLFRDEPEQREAPQT